MSIEITLQDADLGTIVMSANRALEVAHREYMRLRGAFPHITSEAIGAEQQRIFEAIEAGKALPEGDAALQIAAFYEQTVGTVIGLVKEIQGGRGTGAIVANLYKLLAQQTGFLMALDAQRRGDPHREQLAAAVRGLGSALVSFRKGRRKGSPNKGTDKLHAHIRDLLSKGIHRKKLYGEADPDILDGMAEATFNDHVRRVKTETN